MDKRLNIDFCFENNDSSASLFGWEFQIDAGIFLFLRYIKDLDSLKIESKYQDIEINLKDNSKIFAQAKSVQNIDKLDNKTTKLKDSLISLAKTPNYIENKLIYITNIPSPLLNDEQYFKNNLVEYKNFRNIFKEEIDNKFLNCIYSIEKEIINNKNTLSKKKRLILLKERIQNFPKNNFFITSIYPYTDLNGNRCQVLKEEILDFLVNKVNINKNDAISINQKLLEYWQTTFLYNASKKDDEKKDKIKTKKELTWPIAVLLSDLNIEEIKDCLSFRPDGSFYDEIKLHLNESNFIYHERFEFMHKVLTKYERFKEVNIKKQFNLEIEKIFIKDEDIYQEYKNEFDYYEPQLQEFYTKYFLYRIIRNNRNLLKIQQGVN